MDGELSGNNGVATLSSNPKGEFLDAILHTNRTSSSEERSRRFGTWAVMEWVDTVLALGGWKIEGCDSASRGRHQLRIHYAHEIMGSRADSGDTNSAADSHAVANPRRYFWGGE